MPDRPDVTIDADTWENIERAVSGAELALSLDHHHEAVYEVGQLVAFVESVNYTPLAPAPADDTAAALREAARRSIRVQASLDPLPNMIPDDDTARQLQPFIESITGREFAPSDVPIPGLYSLAAYARSQLRRWALREFNTTHAHHHTQEA